MNDLAIELKDFDELTDFLCFEDAAMVHAANVEERCGKAPPVSWQAWFDWDAKISQLDSNCHQVFFNTSTQTKKKRVSKKKMASELLRNLTGETLSESQYRKITLKKLLKEIKICEEELSKPVVAPVRTVKTSRKRKVDMSWWKTNEFGLCFDQTEYWKQMKAEEKKTGPMKRCVFGELFTEKPAKKKSTKTKKNYRKPINERCLFLANENNVVLEKKYPSGTRVWWMTKLKELIELHGEGFEDCKCGTCKIFGEFEVCVKCAVNAVAGDSGVDEYEKTMKSVKTLGTAPPLLRQKAVDFTEEEQKKIKKEQRYMSKFIKLRGGGKPKPVSNPLFQSEADIYNRHFLNDQPLPSYLSPGAAIRIAINFAAKHQGVALPKTDCNDALRVLQASNPFSKITANIQKFRMRHLRKPSVNSVVSFVCGFVPDSGKSRFAHLSMEVLGATEMKLGGTLSSFIRGKIDLHGLRELYKSFGLRGSSLPKGNNLIQTINVKSISDVAAGLSLRDIPMRGVVLNHSLFDKFAGPDYPKSVEGCCVPDYIFRVFQVHKYHTKKTLLEIRRELQQVCLRPINEGITTTEIESWLVTNNYDGSLWALDGVTKSVFHKSLSKGRTNFSLVFIVSNDHLYPILDEKYRQQIFKSDAFRAIELDSTSIVAETDDLEFTTDEERVAKGDAAAPVLYTDVDLTPMISRVTDEQNCIVGNIAFEGPDVIKFTHPNGKLIIRHEYFEQCKTICELMHSKYPGEEFIFKGQGYTRLSKMIQKLTIGTLPKETGTAEQFDFLETYNSVPMVQNLKDISNPKCIDMVNCYPSSLLNTEYPFLVFSECDDILEFSNQSLSRECFYFVEKFVDPVFGTKHAAQTMTYELAEFLIRKGLMKKSNILYFRRSRQMISGSHFQELIREFKNLEEATGIRKLMKTLANRWIGSTNQSKINKRHGYITRDFHEASALISMVSCREDMSITRMQIDDNHILKINADKPIKNRLSYIWTQVVCKATKTVFEKCFELLNAGCEIVGMKTDAVLFQGNVDVADFIRDSSWKPEKTQMPQTTHFPNRETMSFPQQEWDIVNKSIGTNLRKGVLIDGIAGSGKTTLQVKMIERLLQMNPSTKICVASFTHNALGNLRKKIQKRGIQITKNGGISVHTDLRKPGWEYRVAEQRIKVPAKCLELRTITSLKASADMAKESLPYDWIFIDEFSMVSPKAFMSIGSKRGEAKFVLAGDENQCPYIEGGTSVLYKVNHTGVVKQLCDNQMVRLPYIEKTARYDTHLKNFADYFIKHKMIPDDFESRVKPQLEENIVYYNKTKRSIWSRFRKEIVVGSAVIVEFDSMTQKPLIQSGVYHTGEYKIMFIEEGKYYVDVSGSPVYVPREFLQPTTAMTVYKKQGRTIFSHYNIHDTDKMTFENFYTAVTRGKLLQNVNFDADKIRGKVFRSVYNTNITVFPVKLEPTSFYKITIGDHSEIIGVPMSLKNIPGKIACGKVRVGCTIENVVAKQIAVEFQSTGFHSTEFECEKYLSRLNGEKHSYISGYANKFSESLLPIEHKNGQFTIRKTIDGQKFQIRVSSLDKAQKKREELLQKYYPSLIEGERYKTTHKLNIESTQQKPNHRFITKPTPIIAPESQAPCEPPIKMPQILKDSPEQSQTKIMFGTKWYKKQSMALHDAVINDKMLVKWIEKKSNRFNKWDSHSFNSLGRKQFVDLIQMLNKNDKTSFLQEITGKNARLACDIDMDRDEMDVEFEDDYVPLMMALVTVRTVMEKHGVCVDPQSFRILNACTKTKISFHVVYLDEIFRQWTEQKAFWHEVAEESKQMFPLLWFSSEHKSMGTIQKCAFDVGVYTKNRAFRTIFAEKDGKRNPLLPVKFVNGKWKVLENLTPSEISEYLITAPDLLETSVLAKTESKVEKKKHRYYQTKKKDEISKKTKDFLKNYIIPEGFSLDNGVQSDHFLTLYRLRPSFCKCCGRTHDRQNLGLNLRNKTVTCFSGNHTSELAKR